MKRLLPILALVLPMTGRAEAATAANDPAPPAGAVAAETLTLEPMTVNGDTRLAFGFGLTVVRVENSHQLLSLQVDRVQPGSDAERKGLKHGARILSINGRSVSSYEATFVYGSELNRIFVDRSNGARVTLQVQVPGKKKPQTLTIVRRTLTHELPKIGGLPTD